MVKRKARNKSKKAIKKKTSGKLKRTTKRKAKKVKKTSRKKSVRKKARPARKAKTVKKSVKKKVKKTKKVIKAKKQPIKKKRAVKKVAIPKKPARKKKAIKAKKPARITKPTRKASPSLKTKTPTQIKTPAMSIAHLSGTIKQSGAVQRSSKLGTVDYTKTPQPTDIEKIVAMISDATRDYATAEATKFDIGLKHDGAAHFEQELPTEYGKDQVVLLAVDPNFVFAYWEIRENSLRSATEHVGSDSKLTLRFYDVGTTLTPEQSNFWDIEVFDRLGNWYLKLNNPDQKLCIDIGMKNSHGRFHRITRSNFIRLPAQSLAKPGPIKWMIISPEGDKIISDVEEYTDADLALLKKILGPYFYDLLMRGRLASIAGSSVEAVFYDVDQLKLGASPSGSPPWGQANPND